MNPLDSLRIALDHYLAGRLPEAEGTCREVLGLQPDHPDALHLLGLIAQRGGDLVLAEQMIRRAIAVSPKFPQAFSNLGNVLRSAGRLDEAVGAYRRAVELQPDFADAWNNLGNALREKGQAEDAVTACQQALRLKPDFPEAMGNLGNALMDRGKYSDALAVYGTAVRLRPDSAIGHQNMGTCFVRLGRMEDACSAFRRAIELNPTFREAHDCLGNALHHLGRLDDAIAILRRSVALAPDSAPSHHHLGAALRDAGFIDEALAELNRAIALCPDDADFRSSRVFAMHLHPKFTAREIYQEHRLWNDRIARTCDAHVGKAAPPYRSPGVPGEGTRNPDAPESSPQSMSKTPYESPAFSSAHPHARLKIGYVSFDFREHPVAQFLLPILENHDRRQFEIFAYSDVYSPDAMTNRLRAQVDTWRDTVGMPNDILAQRVRDDEIDILVDLAGHTPHNRLLVFARRPAPVQVSYLGYPDTSGIDAINYRLTDAYADPPGASEQYCAEQLVRLAGGFLCFSPSVDGPAVEMPPILARGYVTFGSFNHGAKLSDKILSIWAKILRRVSDSRLLLKCRAMGSRCARDRIIELFADQGIEPRRISLHDAVTSPIDHLRMYQQIDIALDTYPYHGTTTTCESLWMGAPVVTLAGPTHARRVGVSILCYIGLDELVATSEEQYIDVAVRLAGDPSRLTQLRMGLRERMRRSSLMDAPGFTRSVEKAYREMRGG